VISTATPAVDAGRGRRACRIDEENARRIKTWTALTHVRARDECRLGDVPGAPRPAWHGCWPAAQ
jgi:hypothetical protein